MKAIQVSENVYWVGGIDWRLRNFHGYLTQRGSTYNAYLIIDEKITLIDTVKEHLYEEMFERISDIIDPKKIDYIVSNHTEMDHSGAIPMLNDFLGKPKIFASPKGVTGLKEHFGDNLDIEAKKTGDTLNIGKRTLHFVNTPMVHWPDNMVTWSPEDNILFSNDAFGQHLATTERFDDEYFENIVFEEAQKYYANIVLPYGIQVKKALDALKGLPIEIIAPAHGVIWRNNVKEIIEHYHRWSANSTRERALIVYDTMWGSTEKIARAMMDVFNERGIKAEMINVQDTHISDIMTDLIDAKYICVGTPTLNNGMLPSISAFLTYVKGLAPKNRYGIAFGSFGWGGHGVKEVDEVMHKSKFNMLEPLKAKFIPHKNTIAEIQNQFNEILDTVNQ